MFSQLIGQPNPKLQNWAGGKYGDVLGRGRTMASTISYPAGKDRISFGRDAKTATTAQGKGMFVKYAPLIFLADWRTSVSGHVD